MHNGVHKIKQTLILLGFPQSFVDCLVLNNLYPDGKYSSIVDYIFDTNGVKLGYLRISHSFDTKQRHIAFCFDEQQSFIKNLALTTYNKKTLYAYCCIQFDSDFNFLYFSLCDNLEIKADQLKYPYNIDIWFDFDINLDLIQFSIQGYSDTGQNLFYIERVKENFLPMEDELLLIEFLQYQYNADVVNYVPEFYIPSAYDFNSEELKRRMLLVEMLQFQ